MIDVGDINLEGISLVLHLHNKLEVGNPLNGFDYFLVKTEENTSMRDIVGHCDDFNEEAGDRVVVVPLSAIELVRIQRHE